MCADLLPWSRGARTGSRVNYVAVLALLAATSFALPLLVQACEQLGLTRGASVVASLVLAVAWVTFWLVRTLLRRPGRPSRRAPSAPRGAPGAPAGAASVVESASLRLLETEEESRAGL